MGVWQVTFVGIVMVFLIFVLLYLLFLLMGLFTKATLAKEKKRMQLREIEVQVGGAEEEEEIAAVIAAIYSMLGGPVKIKRVKTERGWIIWTKDGWRGVRGWRESSRYE